MKNKIKKTLVLGGAFTAGYAYHKLKTVVYETAIKQQHWTGKIRELDWDRDFAERTLEDAKERLWQIPKEVDNPEVKLNLYWKHDLRRIIQEIEAALERTDGDEVTVKLNDRQRLLWFDVKFGTASKEFKNNPDELTGDNE